MPKDSLCAQKLLPIPSFPPTLGLSLELSRAPSIFSWLLGLLFPNDDAISFRVGDSS